MLGEQNVLVNIIRGAPDHEVRTRYGNGKRGARSRRREPWHRAEPARFPWGAAVRRASRADAPMPRRRGGQVPRAGRGPNTVPCLAPVEEAARACVGSERRPLVMPSAEMVEKEAAEIFSISNGMFWSSSYPRRHAVCWRGRPRSLPPWAGPLTSKRGPRGQSTQSE